MFAHDMRNQISGNSRTKPSERRRMVGFYRELCDQLIVNRIDDLADSVVEAADRCEELFFSDSCAAWSARGWDVPPEFTKRPMH